MKLNKVLFLFSIFCFFNAYSQADEKSPLETLKSQSKGVPSELNLMISHLKESQLSEDQVIKIIATLNLINDDMKSIPQANTMFLLKSEIYKGILTNQYLKQGNVLQISLGVIKSMKANLKKHSIIYTTFSKWLIESFLKDFDPFLEKNFINNYQSIKRSDYKGQLQVKKLNKILKYHSAWINAINNYSPEEFNHLCTKIILDTTERISKKTYYFKTFYGSVEKNPEEDLFNIPNYTPKAQSKQSLEEADKTLKEQAQDRKKAAEQTVKNLEADDLSELSQEIDKITPEK